MHPALDPALCILVFLQLGVGGGRFPKFTELQNDSSVEVGAACENSCYSSPRECPGEALQGFPATDLG